MTHCNCSTHDALLPLNSAGGDAEQIAKRSLIRWIGLVVAAPLRLHRYRELAARLRCSAYESADRGGRES